LYLRVLQAVNNFQTGQPLKNSLLDHFRLTFKNQSQDFNFDELIENRKCLILLNKHDLLEPDSLSNLKKLLEKDEDVILASCLAKNGFQTFRKRLGITVTEL
jgi:tRNA U34 5-carboxymethylaminomethyl modifying GTPase MnmE/TrmE